MFQNGVVSGHLFAKTYGAQKIYCIKQASGDPIISDDDKTNAENIARELELLTSTIKTETESLENLRKTLSLQQQLKASTDRESHLIDKLRALHKQIGCLESANAQQGPFADIGDELRATFDRVSQEFSKRKRIANNLLGFLSETADMSRKDLIEELGLESVPSTLHTPQSTLSPCRGC